MWSASVAGAAQESYDIDLKDLRRAPVRPTKELLPPHKPSGSTATQSVSREGSSTYIVRPGDHLYLILIRRYGLSNEAAEQLIPQIMHQNGIRNPKSLTVGQQLSIPLPPAANKPSPGSHKKIHRTRQPEATSAQPQPLAADSPPYIREVVAPPSKPCVLARDVADRLGVRVSTFFPFMSADSISMSYDVQKVAVACGLAPDEAYTLERLLARHGVKVLIFKNDEAPRAVIEKIAGRLGIPFRLSNANANAELPVTYLFPAAIDGNDLRLTIRPELDTSK